LVNAADQPELCDFYLGSIVNKGNLKIAISTNGKSPNIAKRLKETLHESLPEQLDDLILNLNKLRNQLSGDFKNKVHILNKVTENLSFIQKILISIFRMFLSSKNLFWW
jgi:siroheme synthase-like protein